MNKTGIQYLDFTWNPVTGCTFGCPECWARKTAKRIAAINEAAWRDDEAEAYRTFAPTLHPERLDQPSKRKKPATIGVCFMGDLFDPGLNHHETSRLVNYVPVDTPHHTYIYLTKRPDKMACVMLNKNSVENSYLGFSARNQKEFDAGWQHMSKLAAAGWKVWVSLEPMQGPVSIEDICSGCPDDISTNCEDCNEIPPSLYLSGVILGAQSGSNAVPLGADWVRTVRDQCAAAGVPFMYKQGPEVYCDSKKIVSLPFIDDQQHKALAWKVEG